MPHQEVSHSHVRPGLADIINNEKSVWFKKSSSRFDVKKCKLKVMVAINKYEIGSVSLGAHLAKKLHGIYRSKSRDASQL